MRCCQGEVHRFAGRRRGLTLMELVVVLTILVVLGGLVIAAFPNLLKRTHLATHADTIANLNNIWNQSHAMNSRYPDVYDSLLDNTGTTLHTRLVPKLSDQCTTYTLTANDVTALRSIGITRVVDLAAVPAGGSVTYDAAPLDSTALIRVLATGGVVARLDLTAHEAAGNSLKLKRHLIRNSDGSTTDNRAKTVYLVFGVGANSTAVGTGKRMQEAPVHFGGDSGSNPTDYYQRYLVIFSLVDDGSGAKTAYFEGAAAPGNATEGPTGAEESIREYHEGARSDG